MSRTFRGNQRKDGKRSHKPPKWYKKMKAGPRRTREKMALKEGREPIMEKNCNTYDWN